MNKTNLSNNNNQPSNIESANSKEYIFEYKTDICLIYKYNDNLNIFAYKDNGRRIYLYDEVSLDLVDDNFISDNELIIAELLMLDNKCILIRYKSYENVDIGALISQPDFLSSEAVLSLYFNLFSSSDLYDPEDFLPLIEA